MNQQQAKEVANRFINALHQIEDGEGNDVSSIVDMFADDAQLTNSIIEHDKQHPTRNGRDEIQQFWQEYKETFPQVHSEFMEVTVSEHSAGLFWRTKGSDATGRALEYEGVSLLTLDDSGKIKQFKGYFNPSQFNS